jgi:hypothetical protein
MRLSAISSPDDLLEQRFLSPARARLGDQAWEAASAEGRRMDADAAAAYALDPDAANGGRQGTERPGSSV